MSRGLSPAGVLGGDWAVVPPTARGLKWWLFSVLRPLFFHTSSHFLLFLRQIQNNLMWVFYLRGLDVKATAGIRITSQLTLYARSTPPPLIVATKRACRQAETRVELPGRRRYACR